MSRCLSFLALGLIACMPGQIVTAQPSPHPLKFFEGRTESDGTLKIIMQKPIRTRSLNRGRIEQDGSLFLVQTVQDEGKPARERRWRIKATGLRTFAATMSEAIGPVTVEEVNGRYRFRFKMKGNLAVEQWLSPLPDGKTARSAITVRKFGVTVATSNALVRKVD